MHLVELHGDKTGKLRGNGAVQGIWETSVEGSLCCLKCIASVLLMQRSFLSKGQLWDGRICAYERQYSKLLDKANFLEGRDYLYAVFILIYDDNREMSVLKMS